MFYFLKSVGAFELFLIDDIRVAADEHDFCLQVFNKKLFRVFFRHVAAVNYKCDFVRITIVGELFYVHEIVVRVGGDGEKHRINEAKNQRINEAWKQESKEGIGRGRMIATLTLAMTSPRAWRGSQ